MRVIPQREPGGELYVRPGTCALLSDSLHNICPNGQNLGGTNSIGVPPPLRILGGRVPPVPPGVYAYAHMLSSCSLIESVSIFARQKLDSVPSTAHAPLVSFILIDFSDSPLTANISRSPD